MKSFLLFLELVGYGRCQRQGLRQEEKTKKKWLIEWVSRQTKRVKWMKPKQKPNKRKDKLIYLFVVGVAFGLAEWMERGPKELTLRGKWKQRNSNSIRFVKELNGIAAFLFASSLPSFAAANEKIFQLAGGAGRETKTINLFSSSAGGNPPSAKREIGFCFFSCSISNNNQFHSINKRKLIELELGCWLVCLLFFVGLEWTGRKVICFWLQQANKEANSNYLFFL